MPQPDLRTLLGLVGELTDDGEEKSSAARFRTFLRENQRGHADVREYVELALSSSGDQYNMALQDLVNHVGTLLGFEVEYGRYRCVSDETGFDGLWHSPSGATMVIELKMANPYSADTAPMLTRLDAVGSSHRIKDRSRVFGLYVLAHPKVSAAALDRAILSDARRQPLRVISLDALLSLLGLVQDHGIRHEMVLSLLSPATVVADPMVNLVHYVADPQRSPDDSDLSVVSMAPAHEAVVASAEPVALRQPAKSRRTGAATLLPIEQEHLEFWTDLLTRARARTRLHARATPRERHYLVIHTGVGGLSLAYNIFVRGYAAVELYIDRGNRQVNKAIFDHLAKHTHEIERRFGDTITWQRLNEKRACRLIYRMPGGGLYDRDRWPEIQDRMIDAMIRLEAALRPYLDALEI